MANPKLFHCKWTESAPTEVINISKALSAGNPIAPELFDMLTQYDGYRESIIAGYPYILDPLSAFDYTLGAIDAIKHYDSKYKDDYGFDVYGISTVHGRFNQLPALQIERRLASIRLLKEIYRESGKSDDLERKVTAEMMQTLLPLATIALFLKRYCVHSSRTKLGEMDWKALMQELSSQPGHLMWYTDICTSAKFLKGVLPYEARDFGIAALSLLAKEAEKNMQSSSTTVKTLNLGGTPEVMYDGRIQKTYQLRKDPAIYCAGISRLQTFVVGEIRTATKGDEPKLDNRRTFPTVKGFIELQNRKDLSYIKFNGKCLGRPTIVVLNYDECNLHITSSTPDMCDTLHREIEEVISK